MRDAQFLFVAEYPCDRHCRVELDLDDENPRATVAMLRRSADREHKRICTPSAGAMPSFEAIFQQPA